MILVRRHASRLRGLFEGQRLRARSLRATGLVMGSLVVTKGLQLGSNLVLTRILFPEAFGLMALVGVFIAGIQLISDIGIRPSLIRSSRGEDPEFQSTAWTLQVVRGVWITVLALLLAWPYALIYDQPILAPLISVVAFSAVFTGFASIQNSVQARQLILGKVVTMQIIGRLVDVVVMVAFAWYFQSVWGLAIGNVVGTAVSTALSHVILPSPHHRFAWNRSVLSEIVTFGRWILLATLFTFLGTRGLQAVRGYLIELDTLAFLHIAMMFSIIIVEIVQRVLGTVGFPVMSEVVRDNPGRIKAMTAKIRTLQTLISTPAFLAMAALAPWVIGFLYDDRYALVGPYLTMMALANALAVLPLVYQKTLLALGDSRTHAFVTGSASALRITAVFAGFWVAGVPGMLIADGLALLVVFAFSAAIAVRGGYATLKVDLLNLAAIGAGYLIFVPPLLRVG